jgi:putative ABC transport system permease protein
MMPMLTDWILRLRSLFRRERVDYELDQEMRFHLDQQIDAYIRQGMTRERAVRRATIEFGHLSAVREEHHDARGVAPVTHLVRDLRHALRQARRTPAFTALAVSCLGLGIGVNTSIFAVLNAAMFRPLAVQDPTRLVVMSRGTEATFSFPTYHAFRERNQTLSGLTASSPHESDLDIDGDSQFVAAEGVSANYGAVMGIRTVLGRWFVNDKEPAAVISDAIWRRRFDRSPDVLGRRIRSQSESYTIVGVAAPEYSGVFSPIRTDLWVPMHTRPSIARVIDDPSAHSVAAGGLMLFGRLRTDATPAQTAADLNAIDARLTAETGRQIEVVPPIAVEPARGIINPDSRRGARQSGSFLSFVVGLVLLIACVNVGNLLLVRGAVRQREFAVRRALGASRGRLLQQLLAESLVVAVAGGICGLMLARWTTALLQRSLPLIQGIWQAQLDFSFDWTVIAYATLVSLVTTILCGLLPAWRAAQTSVLVAFKGEILIGRPRRRPLGVVAQVLMSFVLLIVCGTFIQALLRMQAADPGFAVEGRLYAFTNVSTPGTTPAAARLIYANAIERLKALPGVRHAAISDSLPLLSNGTECVSRGTGVPRSINVYAIQSGYFETMNIRMIDGEDFAPRDRATDASAVIVNDQLARTLWPNARAVGQQAVMGCKNGRPATVIGVVSNSAIRSLGETPRPQIFVPFARLYEGGLTAILLDTSTPPARLVDTVRRTLVELGQGMRVYTVEPLSDHVDKSFAPIKWQSSVLTAFGLLALVLAAVGLYGVIAYRVALRTREIGVRMALGAGRDDVFREIVGQGVSIALVGVLIGETLAIAIGRALGSLDADIRPPGLIVLAVTGLIWITVAILAAYIPAARASSVNPLIALRYE